MEGFYSIWTKPFFSRNKDCNNFFMADHELLTFVLSVTMYQKFNGKCSIYLDDVAEEYLNRLGLLSLFEGNIYKLQVDEDIDPNIFWAAGKIFAMNVHENPFVMIDTDLIIWKNLDELLDDAQIFGIHRERISDEIYPNPFNFKMNDIFRGYLIDSIKDYLDVRPLNTALLYSSNRELILDYTNNSIDFMKNCYEKDDYLRPMVFAEQRLLPIYSHKYNLKTKTFCEYAEDINNQQYFTHLWGHKDILKFNYHERVKFNKRVLERLYCENIDNYKLVTKALELN